MSQVLTTVGDAPTLRSLAFCSGVGTRPARYDGQLAPLLTLTGLSRRTPHRKDIRPNSGSHAVNHVPIYEIHNVSVPIHELAYGNVPDRKSVV